MIEKMANPLMCETIFFDKWRCDDAERLWQEKLAQSSQSSLVSEIAKAREQIQKSLKSSDGSQPHRGIVHCPAGNADGPILCRVELLEQENKNLQRVTQDLQRIVKQLENRIAALEGGAPLKKGGEKETSVEKPVSEDEDDDDIDLFGSDDDEDEAERLKQERIAQYQAKKEKKPQVIAKSNVIFDIKPWDDETDMKVLEDEVRKLTMDGLKWGPSKLVPVAFGIKKLQIATVIEDDKVSTEVLEEQMLALEDYVQSVDIAAFNKV